MDSGYILSILIWFGGSASIAALVALLVDVLKRFGVVKDGDAGRWAAGFNLLGLVGFSAYFFLNPAIGFDAVDAQLQNVLAIVQVLLGFVLQLFVSPKVHMAGIDAMLPPFLSLTLREMEDWED